MNLFDRFIPEFLKRLDRHLLLNHRLIWETKFHYVLFYGLVGIGLTLLIGTIYPVNTVRSIPDLGIFSLLTAIPSFILLAFWVYKQYLHTIENDYGKLNSFMGHKRLMIYATSAILFMAPTFILPSMIYNRLGNVAVEANMDVDRVILNEGNPFFPTKNRYRNTPDNIFNYLDCNSHNSVENCDKGQIFDRFGGSEMPLSYESQDRLKDVFITELDTKEAYSKIIAFIQTIEKYGGRIHATPEEVLNGFVHQEANVQQNLSEVKQAVHRKMRSLSSYERPLIRKSKNLEIWGSIVIAFSLFAILFQLIKSISLRDLIITAVTVLGLGIGSTILALTFHEFRGVFDIRKEEFITVFALGLYAFALYHAVGVNRLRSYSRFKTVMLSMANIATPFLIPWLVLTVDTWDVTNLSLRDEQVVIYMLAGIAMYTFVFFPWFRKLHLRMHSLPRG